MLSKPSTHSDHNLFHPDFIADSVVDVDFKLLNDRGIKAVLIDLDGTVVSRGTYDVNDEITKFLGGQPVDIYIATNRPKSRDLKNLKQQLHATGVIHPKGIFAKPFPQYYKQAATDHQLKPSEVAMIGDRFLQDIFGANLAGLTTVQVRKLGTSHGFFDKQLSLLEKRYTNKLANKYSRG